MFHQTAFKWLSITIIVLVAFLIVLLFLGYLLKENEEKTIELKAQLEQQAYQQHEKNRRKQSPSSHLPVTLTALEKSQQKIIADNQSCQTAAQCFLVEINSQTLGCIVAVNTTGAAILLKTAAMNNNQQLSNENCQQAYVKQNQLLAQCVNNHCTY